MHIKQGMTFSVSGKDPTFSLKLHQLLFSQGAFADKAAKADAVYKSKIIPLDLSVTVSTTDDLSERETINMSVALATQAYPHVARVVSALRPEASIVHIVGEDEGDSTYRIINPLKFKA
jgi:hypothetical protein